MGTGFTIDTPLRVARYGISSVLSLVDDVLIEQMRKFLCEQHDEPYEEIALRDQDSRARRITAYLNLVDRLLQRQVTSLQASPFAAGSEITRYYELLPESPLRQTYDDMLATAEPAEKQRRQEELRRRAVPGGIDVNIMTKLDADAYEKGQKLPPEFASAMAALRGYANSTVSSAIIFSAGLNQRLYAYLAQFEDFFPDAGGNFKKTIILKVSDYRSALVQGKFLAKRGLWISEYRIESGLNCGGHAFPTHGLLLGPILDEFRRKRPELVELLHRSYRKALAAQDRSPPDTPLATRVTIQGGIVSAGENDLLHQHYEVDGTGWGTPFLLVPEAANIDKVHLEKLLAATTKDSYLSESSPLMVPFWNLRNSASEEAREQRNRGGKPGSDCPKGYLTSTTEFTERPLCTASRAYIRQRLAQLGEENLPPERLARLKQSILAKSCICSDLAGAATVKFGINPEATTAVCCGPSILNFKKLATLEEMVGHIYGRLSLVAEGERPHMFIRELMLYVEYLREEIEKFSLELSTRTQEYFHKFRENLLAGVEYYQGLSQQLIATEQDRFLKGLNSLRKEIEGLSCLALSPES